MRCAISQDFKNPVLQSVDLKKRHKISSATFSNDHPDIEATAFYIGFWEDRWLGGRFELRWDGWYMYGTNYRDGIQLYNFEKLYAVIEGDNTNEKI